MRDESSLLQGTLDILVLRALVDGPQHGYAVARWIHEVTDGELTVGDRALYVALHRADERGWVSASWGKSENNRRARFYELTAAGRHALATRSRRWKSYATAMAKALEGLT
jgi:transcriptional regulator